jgi:O-antigen/teichoic acid export membrane protein
MGGVNRRKALHNVFVKAASVPVEKACRFLLFAVAARTLGEAGFGRFQFADTAMALSVFATELGLGIWTTRALARTPAAARAIVGTGLWLRCGLLLPYLALVAVEVVLAGPGPLRGPLLALGGAALAGIFVDYCNAVFRGYERLRDEARLNVVRAALLTVTGLSALWWQRSVLALSVGVLVGTFVAAAHGLALLRSRYHLPVLLQRGTFNRRLARAAVAEALPLWLATLMSLVYFKGDTVLLRWLTNDEAVGSYAAAFKVFEGTMILPSVILAAFFPMLVRAGLSDRREHRRTELELGALLLGLGALVGATLYVAAGAVLRLMFGAGFLDGAHALRVLSVAVPILFFNFGLTHFLIARHLERRNLMFATVMVVLNLGANLVLIPRLGGVGAAWATLITEIALTVCCLLTLAGGGAGGNGPPLASERSSSPAASSTGHTPA